ncbi:hypothetical protein CBR64_20495 [Cellulosimicrobium cellulans]|uniref:Uncharacterized protein n=1 Tax=Cellulosimicrobium cellulans TaxID=1710 RepID=A0A1Y0I0X6_CELCE|nr:hypothetical protein [Cellulosimicrobium cellulans]ARU53456.1 hypothetical protein CBR64_20495 [Cellulosimicrobium cellulans]
MPSQVDVLVVEAQRLGIVVDMKLTRWRTKYPPASVDGVLARVPAGLKLTLNGRSSHAAQAHALRVAIKAVDVEPAAPDWEYFPELDSWLRPIVAPA